MKLFMFAFMLLLSGCKTCETTARISEGFTKYVVQSLKCTNRQNIKVDVSDLCSSQNLCSKKEIISASGPSPAWSEAGLSCLFIVGALENMAVRNKERWGCQEYLLDTSDLSEVCAKL